MYIQNCTSLHALVPLSVLLEDIFLRPMLVRAGLWKVYPWRPLEQDVLQARCSSSQWWQNTSTKSTLRS